MSRIVLSTLNATYQHCAFGLRYLYANLGELQSEAEIVEFTIAQNARDIAETVLAKRPEVVGFGVYIWNVRETERVVSILREVAPEMVIVLGGPEVSYEWEGQSIGRYADYVVRGEGEFLFRRLVGGLLGGGAAADATGRTPMASSVFADEHFSGANSSKIHEKFSDKSTSGPVEFSSSVFADRENHASARDAQECSPAQRDGSQKRDHAHRDGARTSARVISGPLPDIATLTLPYRYYSDEDIRNRVIYVEASRGCPFKCEFCLSALDTAVRNFPLDEFLHEMELLILRGARQFKFVDRTFNLNPAIGKRILDFFLSHIDKGLFLHFEMIPDRLPAALKESIAKFPHGSLQFEIGIQTLNPEIEEKISRKQDHQKTRENLHFLTSETSVHLHADLIVGLPGETLESFGRGFDELWHMKPHEIQVGVLKRLKGTPITRYDGELRYESAPPFTVVKTDAMDFSELQSLVRFAKFWDLVANRGNFPHTMKFLDELARSKGSLFDEFYALSKFLNRRHPERHSIALGNLAESLWRYFVEEKQLDEERVNRLIQQDFCDGPVKRETPVFMRVPKPKATPRRQQRHLSHAPATPAN